MNTDEKNDLLSLLIFRLGSVGDTVVALPAFRLVKKAFPNAKISVLTNMPVNHKACALELILQNTGLVDTYIEYPSKSLLFTKAIALRKIIKKNNFSTMVYMHQNRSILNAWRDFLFFKLCGIQKIIGLPLFRHGFQYDYIPEKKIYESEHYRLTNQLKVLGKADWSDPKIMDLTLTSDELEQARAFIPDNIFNQPFIVCSIGTKLVMKDWGHENWKTLLTQLAPGYSSYGMIFIGVDEEYQRSDELLQCWRGPTLNLCGKLTIRQSAALLSFARLFFGHDSGPMHLAAAVNTQCVAVFSRHSKPGWWHPLGSQHKIITPPGESIQTIAIDVVATMMRETLKTKIQAEV